MLFTGHGALYHLPLSAGVMATNILLLGASGFIAVGMFRLTDPILPKIAEDFGTSVGSVATTVTAFTIGYGLFQLLHGPLGDRVGKLRVITGALALASLATIACAWANTVPALSALRFASGMTAGAVAPLSMAHIGDTVPYDSRQAMIARFLMAAMIGQMVAGSLAGFLAEYFGWRLAFIAFGATGLAVSACLWPAAAGAPRPVHHGPAGSRTTHFALLREPQTRIIWSGAFLEGFFIFGAVPYIGAFLREDFGLDYATIGFTLASFGVGALIYSFNVKRLLKRLGEQRMVLAGGSLAAASYFAVTVSPAWQFLIPALALVGLGFFCMHGTLQVRATEIAPRARGTALTGFVLFMFLGQGAGVFAMGYVVDGPGYRATFGIAAVTTFLLMLWLYRALFASHPARK